MIAPSKHKEELLKSLYALYLSDKYCDLTIKVRDGEVKVHSVVVCAGSEYFMRAVPAQDQLRIIFLFDLSLTDIKMVMRFLYTGELLPNDDNESNRKLLRKLGLLDTQRNTTEVAVKSNTLYSQSHIIGDAEVVVNLRGNLNTSSSGGDLNIDNRPRDLLQEVCNVAMITEKELPGKTRSSDEILKVVSQLEPLTAQSTTAETALDQLSTNGFQPDESNGDEDDDDDVANIVMNAALDTMLNSTGDSTSPLDTMIDTTEAEGNSSKKQSKHREQFGKSAPHAKCDLTETNNGNETSDLTETNDVKETSDGELSDTVGQEQNKKSYKRLVFDHKKKKRRRPFGSGKPSCPECDRKFASLKLLAGHRYVKHNVALDPKKYKILKCKVEECSYQTLETFRMELHMTSSHSNERPYVCEWCGKAFKILGALTLHTNTHTKARKFDCTECDKTFTQSSALQRHVTEKHRNDLRHLCEVCPFITVDRVKLVQHKYQQHSTPLPPDYTIYRCDETDCKFETFRKKEFQDHHKGHQGIHEYVCEVCEKAFVTSVQLRGHMNTHKANDIRCTHPGCNFTTRLNNRLVLHVNRMHTDEKPHACPHCPYKSNIKGNLRKHMRNIHTGSCDPTKKRRKRTYGDRNPEDKPKRVRNHKKKEETAVNPVPKEVSAVNDILETISKDQSILSQVNGENIIIQYETDASSNVIKSMVYLSNPVQLPDGSQQFVPVSQEIIVTELPPGTILAEPNQQ